MSEEGVEFDGLVRNMGDLVFDLGDSSESLYHYDAPTTAKKESRKQRFAEVNSLADDAPAAPAPRVAQPATAPAPAASAAPAQPPAKRGLKTPIILGLSAGGLAALGVYGFLRWKRPREESPLKLAGVAGGLSGAGVLVTILAARGAGALKS